MSAQVAADLRAAAEVLRRDGWTQGRFHDANGCHCAVGALEVVAGDGISDRLLDSVRALAAHLRILRGPIPVYRWNDADDRTADEVIAALEAAADAAEADQ